MSAASRRLLVPDWERSNIADAVAVQESGAGDEGTLPYEAG
jgi:hypothetical protein